MDVGKRIVYLRNLKGLTTTKLAYKAGLAQSHLRDIELDKKNPTVETLSYICEALDISMSDFFSENIEERLEESALLRTIYRLSSYQRQLLLSFIESISSDSTSKNKAPTHQTTYR